MTRFYLSGVKVFYLCHFCVIFEIFLSFIEQKIFKNFFLRYLEAFRSIGVPGPVAELCAPGKLGPPCLCGEA